MRVIAFFQLLAHAVFFVGGLRPDFDHSLPPRRGGGEVVLVVLVGPWSKGGLNLVKTWSEFWSSKIEHPCNADRPLNCAAAGRGFAAGFGVVSHVNPEYLIANQGVTQRSRSVNA